MCQNLSFKLEILPPFFREARIWCCSRYVGLLVGPGGGTIKQIMENSGCSSIQSPPRNEKIKYFTLTGGCLTFGLNLSSTGPGTSSPWPYIIDG